MSIDETTFRQLLDFTDPMGVLTLTAGFSPDRAGTAQPAARIDLRNQLKELGKQLEQDGQGERARALHKRISELGEDLDGLLDPRVTGRGRALFVGIGDGQRLHVNVQVPFEERVVLHDRPFLRPVVAAIDEGRPAGIVVPDRTQVRVLEWSLGATRELATMDFELTDAQLADWKRGPVEPNPMRGQTSSSHRESFEDRVDENRRRFLKDVAETLRGMIRTRDWDRVVLAGNARVRDELRGLLESDNGPEVLLSDSSWENLTPGQVAQEAWPLLRSVHRHRERELVEQARSLALSGAAGALGAKKVCDAANRGRVDHLLFTHDTELQGYVSEAGSLHPEIAGAIAQSDLAMTREPRLVERLIERVLSMGGRVTRVDDEEAGAALGAFDGLGALLRW